MVKIKSGGKIPARAGEFRISIAIYSKEILRQLVAFEDLYTDLPKRNGNQDLLEWGECDHVVKLDLQTASPEAVRAGFDAQFYLSEFSHVLIFSGQQSPIH